MTEAATGIDHPAYLEYQEEDYARAARKIALDLEKEEEKGSVSFGPTYYITTKNMEVLEAKTVETPGQTTDERRQVIVALNEKGEVVGHRKTWITPKASPIIAEGSIHTARRGAGITTPLEMVHSHLMQSLANKTGKKVTEKGDNFNLVRLQRIKETNSDQAEAGLPLAYSPELVAALEAEQLRWQHLYGPYGKLGFNPKIERDFEPNDDEIIDDSVDAITIRAVERTIHERIVTVPEVVSITRSSNPQAMQQEKRTFFKQTVLPKLGALGQSLSHV